MRRAFLAILALATTAGATEPPLQARARALVGAEQGVFARAADGTVLAALEADRPRHPASVTKVATSLALLERLGPAHRFETRLLAAGPVERGIVRGDLVVEAGGDPSLVYEDAFLVLRLLRGHGVRAVAGRLRTRGPLFFNWQPDPRGQALGRALAGRDGAAAWAVVADGQPGTLADAGLVFDGAVVAAGAPLPLAVHRSAPLARIVKALNCYSNNVFHPLSERIGGPAVVEEVARAHVPAAARAGLVITDAAGAGTRNRMSPHAAVALVDALVVELARHDLTLADALPVAGADPGTLRERLAGGAVVGKTGTIGSLSVSALAGRARTRRWGEVTFAVLNRGLPVPEAQRRQDAFVRALLDEGGAVPWEYRNDRPPLFTEAQVRWDGAD